nr:hypothetical protein [Anaerolineales bacterium]
GLAVGGFGVRGADGFLVLIRLPIREVLLELTRLLGLVTGGFGVRGADDFLELIILPIREVLPELIRLPELVDTCFPTPELAPAGFLPCPVPLVRGERGLLSGLRVPEAVGGRRVEGRLGTILRG